MPTCQLPGQTECLKVTIYDIKSRFHNKVMFLKSMYRY